MKTKTEIKIFIASPSDTNSERDLIEKYIMEWNSTTGDEEDRNITLRPIRWEKSLAIRSNVEAQDAIDEDLLSKCDMLTGAFWTKFGSSTSKYESGTEGEIKFFLKKGKPVMMYFLDKPVNPSKLKSTELEKIKAFKEEYKSGNIYRETTLDNQDDFRVMFFKDLNRNIKLLFPNAEDQNDIPEVPSRGKREKKKKWYKESIKELIEGKLLEVGLPLPYRRGITFDENVKLWGA